MVFALAFLLTYIPHGQTVSDHVAAIELNHLYDDDNGQHLLDQIIFWDWCEDGIHFEVRAWRKYTSPKQQPLYHWRGKLWHIQWYDGSLMREVTANAMFETWTTHDPELANRQVVPSEERIPLTTPVRYGETK